MIKIYHSYITQQKLHNIIKKQQTKLKIINKLCKLKHFYLKKN